MSTPFEITVLIIGCIAIGFIFGFAFARAIEAKLKEKNT